MFKFKKIALAASIFTATALSLAAFAACGEPVKGDKGDKGDKGETGATGAAGQDGKDGVGIEDIKPGEDGKLIITMTDGTKKEVAMPTVDAPVGEEHSFAAEPITIIAPNGGAGTLSAGEQGTGLYVCADCGDVFAFSTHAHNYTKWAPVSAETNGTAKADNLSWTRDCYVKQADNTYKKVEGETQTINAIKYTDVVSNGVVAEGWTKLTEKSALTATDSRVLMINDAVNGTIAFNTTQGHENEITSTFTAYVKAVDNGYWVVVETDAAKCNKAGSSTIAYYQKADVNGVKYTYAKDGVPTELRDSSDNVNAVATNYYQAFAYAYQNATNKKDFGDEGWAAGDNTAAQTYAKIPQTGHFFDMTTGVLAWQAEITAADEADTTATNDDVDFNVNNLTYGEYGKIRQKIGQVSAQKTNNAGFADGFDKAYYMVVCANCDYTEPTTVAVKTFNATVESKATQTANCVQTSAEKRTASYTIAVGDKTLKKSIDATADTASATTKNEKHIYNVYANKEGNVVAYFYNGVYYKTLEVAQKVAALGSTYTATSEEKYAAADAAWTFYRIETGNVIAINCANCSDGRIAYDIPTTEVKGSSAWTKVANESTDATCTNKGSVKYSVTFTVADVNTASMLTYKTDAIETAAIGHKDVLLTAADVEVTFADQASDEALKNAVDTFKTANLNKGAKIACGNESNAVKIDNVTKTGEAQSPAAGITYNSNVITAVSYATKSEATCAAAKKVTITVTVEIRDWTLNSDGFQVYNVNGVPQYTVKETKTFTYNVNVGNALAHTVTTANDQKKDTILVAPTADSCGLVERKCALCGEVELFVLPALNPAYAGNSATPVEATCVDGAYTTYSYNKYLAYTVNESKKAELSLNGSSAFINDSTKKSYDAGVNGKAYAAGTFTVETAKGEALGHQMGAWKAATGTGTNYKWIRQCERVQANGTLDGYFEVSNSATNPDLD